MTDSREITQVTQVLDVSHGANPASHRHNTSLDAASLDASDTALSSFAHATVDEEEFFSRGQALSLLPYELDTTVPDLDELRLDFDGALIEARHAQPSAVARRAQLRRVFAGVMGFASVLTVVVTAKALARHVQAAGAPMDTALIAPQAVVPSIDLNAPATEVAEVNILANQPEPANAVGDVAIAQQASTPPAITPAPRVQSVSSKSPAPSVGAKAVAPPSVGVHAPSTSPALATPPVRRPSKLEARRLITSGHMQEGIVAARAALQADPSDAEVYLLLGAALQDTGRWNESRAVFTSCVQTASHGPTDECRALRGR